jgi:hypothetical protein
MLDILVGLAMIGFTLVCAGVFILIIDIVFDMRRSR